jgi:hypothetical protein
MNRPAMLMRFHGHSRRPHAWKIVSGMAQNLLKACHFVPPPKDTTKATTPSSTMLCDRAIRVNAPGTTSEFCHNGRSIDSSPRWSRLPALDFVTNEPTTAASASSMKRSHGTQILVETRANEPNLPEDARRNRHDEIGALPLGDGSDDEICANESTRVASIGITKRSHDMRALVNNRANEPNSAADIRHNRHDEIGPMPLGSGSGNEFYTNKPTRAACTRIAKRTHDMEVLVKNRANETNSADEIGTTSSGGAADDEIDTNEPTRVACTGIAKRTHDMEVTIKNRANEPNSAMDARHHRHRRIGPRPRWSMGHVARSARTNPREWAVPAESHEPITQDLLTELHDCDGGSLWDARSLPLPPRAR